MRIVHTSDWHAGRQWKNLNRLAELAAVLENLAGFLVRERVDLLLMSGDVFDSAGPSAEAERMVFTFFRRIGSAGVQSVVIAGNHDHAARLEAWGTLAELVGVRSVGLPRRCDDGGLIEIATRDGERAQIAAVPFASVGRLVSAMDVTGAANVAAQKYADGMQRILEHLANGFEPNAVRAILAHTHLANAILAGSERKVHVGEEWAMTAQAIPDTAQYVALGHIHRHQRVEAPAPTFYAGSPLQLDFGEVGEIKQFLLIEATAHLPVRVEAIPYEGAVPLADVSGTLQELEHEAERYRTRGHLRVKVQLEQRDPDIARKVRQLLPNAVVVMVDEARSDDVVDVQRLAAGAAPRDLYAMYYRKEHGRDADPRLLTAFDGLRDIVAEG
jgi:DNA repair protein SbcD/Mre11